MQLKLNRYLSELRKNALRFEQIDINGNADKSFFSRYFRRIFSSIAAIIALILIHNGFSENFVSYTSTVLSILIGLFITAIIFSFDKFHQSTAKSSKLYDISTKRVEKDNIEQTYKVTIKDVSELSAKEKLWNIQSYNYSKQFAFIIGYNIVLSVFVIVLLAFSSIFETRMSINVCDYNLNLQSINKDTFLNFLNVSFVLFQRFFVIYWTTSIIFNTLFVVSSMVNFMTVKIDRNNDTN